VEAVNEVYFWLGHRKHKHVMGGGGVARGKKGAEFAYQLIFREGKCEWEIPFNPPVQ